MGYIGGEMARGRWMGVTYPSVLGYPVILALWRRICCPRGWHLFDEVDSHDFHYLYCDACDLRVDFDRQA